jgi:hypothetical protein|tara:strand:- start:503 stop:676 length:174 start_codon:yes stop_codon:yes gene_type:complete
MYFLAKELGMTLSALSSELTREELMGWAAYYDLKNEEEQKALDQRKTAQRGRTMPTR